MGARHRGVGPRGGVEQGEDHHGQDGADGAQSHQAEAVLRGVGVAADGGDAQAQGHDEGDGHGAGGDASRVKGDGEKVPGDKGGKGEHDQIEAHQETVQGDPEQDAQQGDDKEDPHPYGHRPDEHRVGHAGDLGGQDLEVGLGHGDDDSNEEAYRHHDPQLAGAGHGRAYPLANGGHGLIGPQSEQPHPTDQQHRPDEESH